MTEEEALRMWEEYLHGQLSKEDERLLLSALKSDTDLRKRVLDDLELHRALMQFGVGEEEFLNSFRERLNAEGDHRAITDAVAEAISREERTPTRAGRRSVFRALVPLAAAAVVLVAVGLYFFHGGASGVPPIRVVMKTGVLQEQGYEFATGDKSYCKLAFADGGIIGMDGNTKLGVTFTGEPAAKHIRQDAGRTYLDVPRQERPMTIDSGMFKMEVLGTRLLVNCTGKEYVTVLDGRVRLMCGEIGTYLRSGQTASSAPDAPVVVATGHPRPETVSWIGQLGVDADSVLRDSKQLTRRMPAGALDMDDYVVRSGRWNIREEGSNTIVSQELPSGGDILFGTPRWKKGDLNCRIKLARPLAPDADVGFGFFYPNAAQEAFSLSGSSGGLWHKYDAWINVHVAFELDTASNALIGHAVDIVVDGHPEAKWSIPAGKKWIRSPAVTSIKARPACGIGLAVLNCAADFKDLRLENAVAVDSKADEPIVSYVFKGGKRERIDNIAADGESAVMTVGQPANVRWLDDGIRLTGAGDLTFKGEMQQLRKAWKQNKALTAEAWIRANPTTAKEDFPWLFMRMNVRGATLWFDLGSEGLPKDRIVQAAWVCYDDGDSFKTMFFIHGGRKRLERSVKGNMSLDTREGPIEFCVAPGGNNDAPGRETKGLWQGDLIALKIYGRKLTAEELRLSSEAGPPK